MPTPEATHPRAATSPPKLLRRMDNRGLSISSRHGSTAQTKPESERQILPVRTWKVRVGEWLDFFCFLIVDLAEMFILSIDKAACRPKTTDAMKTLTAAALPLR
jgi:hypothetical protein